MNTRKVFRLLMCIGAMAGCSAIYGVTYDYDKQTDFGRYKSYDWMPVPAVAGIDEFVVARVKTAVNVDLEAKGLEWTSQNPDFLIAEHIGRQEKIQVEDWGYGYYGPYPRYWGGYWGPDGVMTYQYEEGSLILDFVDADSKKLIWRGAAKAEIQHIESAEKGEKLIDEAVEKILKKYPPASE